MKLRDFLAGQWLRHHASTHCRGCRFDPWLGMFLMPHHTAWKEKKKIHDTVFRLQFTSVQSLSRVWLFITPLTASCQASLSIANSRSLLKLMFIESMMPSNHLILSCPFFLLPLIFPSIRVFSNESVLCIRWPEYWSFSFSISPSNEYSELIAFKIDWFDLLPVQGTLKKSSPTPQFKSISSSVPSFLYSQTLTSIHGYWKNHSFD